MLKAKAFFTILRPLNMLLGVISVLIAAALLPDTATPVVLLKACLIVALFTGGANITNDIFDLEIDKINRPARPLPLNIISKTEALIYAGLLFIGGIFLSVSLPPSARVIALFIVLPLLILYTPVLKKIPLAGNFTIAAILGIVFLFSEAALTGGVVRMVIPATLAFGLSLIREVVKDMQDIPGDRVLNLQTFPIRYGYRPALILSTILVALLSLLAPLPYFTYGYGKWYLIALLFGVEIPLILSIFYLWKNPTSAASGKISAVLKLATIAGMGAIFLSKYP